MTTSPYNTPETNPVDRETTNAHAPRMLSISSIALLFSPAVSVVIVVIYMLSAFSELEKPDGTADNLSKNISLAVDSSIIGLFLGLVGVFVVRWILNRKLNREIWFYRSILFSAFFWIIFFFPVGIYLFVKLRMSRSEFMS